MKTYSILAASLLAAIVLTLSPGVVQAVVIAESDFLDLNGDGELTNDTDGIGWSGGWNEVDEDGSGIVQEGLNYVSLDGVAVNATTALQITGVGSTPGATFSLANRNLAGAQNGDDIYISFLTKYESGIIDSADFYAWSFGTDPPHPWHQGEHWPRRNRFLLPGSIPEHGLCGRAAGSRGNVFCGGTSPEDCAGARLALHSLRRLG